MEEFILKVPNPNHLQDWFKFIEKNRFDTKICEILIIDFNTVGFLHTDSFVVLACLIENFFRFGSTIKFIGGTDKLNSHLDNIKFKKYWEDTFDREKFTVSLNNSTLCLWKISPEMAYSYSINAKSFFEGLVGENKDLVALSSNMDEVFNNIFDHSKSKVSGYIITQFFPFKRKISFSVCDFGIGIANSINNNNKKIGAETIKDYEAIFEAIKKGVTVKSNPRNRGFGLNNLCDFTEQSNGILRIISNNGTLEKQAEKPFKVGKSNFNFKGTLIRVDVDLMHFNEKEETEEVYGF